MNWLAICQRFKNLDFGLFLGHFGFSWSNKTFFQKPWFVTFLTWWPSNLMDRQAIWHMKRVKFKGHFLQCGCPVKPHSHRSIKLSKWEKIVLLLLSAATLGLRQSIRSAGFKVLSQYFPLSSNMMIQISKLSCSSHCSIIDFLLISQNNLPVWPFRQEAKSGPRPLQNLGNNCNKLWNL